MAWKDRLRPASFRGVPFYVNDSEFDGGRRTVTHEYPKRDEPFVEDLGRSARTFALDAYVIGADYMTARDRLREALEKPGPGELVHPTMGQQRVSVVGNFRVREPRSDGGMAWFTIPFCETTAGPVYPRASGSTFRGFSRIIDGALSVAASILAGRLSVGGLPAFARASLLSVTDGLADALATSLLPVVASSEVRAGLWRDILAVRAIGEAGLEDGASVASVIARPFVSFRDSGAPARPAFDAVNRVYEFEASPASAALTATRARERENWQALDGYCRTLACLEAARAAGQVDFEYLEAAVGARDLLLSRLDQEGERAADELFAQFSTVRAQLVKSVPNAENAAARLISYSPPITLPSLLLTWQLYEAIDREGEVVARNRIRHPGFVPGGRPLEVVSRG